MKLKIYPKDKEILRSKSNKINNVTRIRRLSEEMINTINKYDAIGLSAIQIGKPVQLLTIDLRTLKYSPQELIDDDYLVLINPQITENGEIIKKDTEGCLSFPGLFIEIPRYDKIVVVGQRFINNKLTPITIRAHDLFARALQHEIDHLNGKLFIDYLNKFERANILGHWLTK